LGNVPANRQRGIKIQKRIVHALPPLKRVLKIQKLFGVKRITIYKFNIILKGEFKNNEYVAEYLLT
jgi:hypothetical protein